MTASVRRRTDRRRRRAELVGVSRDRGAEPAADAVALHRGADPAPDGVGHPRRVIGSVGEEAQRDRAGSAPAGPGEGLEASHGRGRARSGRETLPAAGAAGAQHGATPAWCASGGGSRGSCVRLRLLGWNVRFNEGPPRGGRARPGVGDRAGGGNDSVYGPGSRIAQRGAPIAASGENRPLPLVAQRTPVLRCAPRSADGPADADFPGELRLDPADHVRDHTWDDPAHTSGRACAPISTPVDAPVDERNGGAP